MSDSQCSQISAAARELLEARRDGKERGEETLVTLLYRPVSYYMRQGIFRYNYPESFEDDLVQEFLFKKIYDDRTFLAGLADLTSMFYINLAVLRYLNEWIRKHPTPEFVPCSYDDEEEDSTTENLDYLHHRREATPNAELEEERYRLAVERSEKILESMSDDERIIFDVLYAEDRGLSQEQAFRLARRRGVSMERVLGEVELRKERIRSSRSLLCKRTDRVDMLLSKAIRRYEYASGLLCSEALERVESTQLDEVTKKRLLNSPQRLIGEVPEVQKAFLVYLLRLIETYRLRKEEILTAEKVAIPGGPEYEDLVRILGLCPENADAKTIATAVNSLTVKIKRIHKRLLKLHMPPEGSL